MAFQLTKLTPVGRIRRKPFWIASLILIGIELATMLLPTYLTQEVAALLLIYPAVCIDGRRLHDLGLSAWWQLPIYVVMAPAMLSGWRVAYAEVVAGSAAAQALEDTQMLSDLQMIATGVAAVASLAFFLWLGLARGRTGRNRFGPEPGAEPVEDVFS